MTRPPNKHNDIGILVNKFHLSERRRRFASPTLAGEPSRAPDVILARLHLKFIGNFNILCFVSQQSFPEQIKV